MPDDLDLRERLRHVYWLGGASGAGKSTIARRIAAKHDLHLYVTDDVMSDHAARSTPEDSPGLAEFAAMDMDERWLNRPPQTMLETFHWFRGEGFHLIVEDLLRVPPETRVLAEGFRLLPSLVRPLLAVPDRAVWLLPTPEFRRTAFEQRGTMWTIAGRTSDPERALRNLLERERMFTERLSDELRELALPLIRVDGTVGEAELADRVAGALRIA